MKKSRISQLGREQIENAAEIIICRNNAYYESKYADPALKIKFKDDPFLALAVRENGFNSIVLSGDLASWRFLDLKNGIRAIKRINNNVSIKIFSDEEINKFIQIEKLKDMQFMEAVKKFNNGDKEELIEFLKEDNLKHLNN